MAAGVPETRGSHLFTVRLWIEDTGEESEYRGQVRHVLSGSSRYFRRWPELGACLAALVGEATEAAGGTQPGRPAGRKRSP